MGRRDGGPSARRALVVDRDSALRRRIARHLSDALGLETAQTSSNLRARKRLAEGARPDLLIVGFERPTACDFIAHARSVLPETRILVVDATSDETSVAEAFAAGAHDVMHAPFPFPELEARLGLDPADRKLSTPDPILSQLALTPVEREIMTLLLARPGQIVTRDQLARRIDKSDWTYGDRKFDVHVTNIRKKLQATFGDRFSVGTIRSLGYLLRESGREN